MGKQIRKHCMCSSGGQKPFHVEIEKQNLSKQVINKSTFLQLWGFHVEKKWHGNSKNSWTDFKIWISCSCTLIRTHLQTDTTSWWRINRILNSVICYEPQLEHKRPICELFSASGVRRCFRVCRVASTVSAPCCGKEYHMHVCLHMNNGKTCNYITEAPWDTPCTCV